MKRQIIPQYVKFIFVCVLICSCENITDTVSKIKEKPLSFPEKELYIFNSLSSRFEQEHQFKFRLLYYLDRERCMSCFLSQLVEYERDNLWYLCNSEVEMVYIFDLDKENYYLLEDELVNARFQGTVYIDTCHAFLQANPHIPDNELFHTFVINDEGKVLMVGNPFQNEKMESLFKKVIANEKKRHKKKDAA